MSVIKIGTRSSKLALWQAYHIQDLLKAKGLESELVTFETKGDKILDKSLSKIGSKGLFTEELESSLLSGETHIAVHSAKDLPSTLPDDLEIIAFTEREEFHDVLVSDDKIDLSSEVIVGTSSTRRVALLKHYYPQVKIVPMRGNLQTRMAKMRNGDCDALMLAYAGVHRMGYGESIKKSFSVDQIVPPVGQGTLAIEAAKNLDSAIRDLIIEACKDIETSTSLIAERSFLKVLNGGCSVPIYAFASLKEEQLTLKGGIISLNGQEKIDVSITGDKNLAEVLGENLANELLEKGGKEILEKIKLEL